ncbi:amidohydrolase family protein [Streptomyces nodosus]|uniref:Amidohydrolase n=1 Tax=Streptomyces nodosus TaxID=40318 RepID=A0A0B5DTK6_9ACTN|nr:amidohydrolase family protein [Streptomyces nodosus]AJE44006.1 amidohydrolase [Streptomyces nodosus]MBB4795582.1 putative TIM-barrel fold metal-dependent hydrolase [Streptomyces nodosus]QEV42506.1 amidohydrolase [Streptomyces nodosus]
MSTELSEGIAALPLVDHHVHSALASAVTREQFERLITESDRPLPAGVTSFDSQTGFAIRRHCAPLLGLPARAPADAYWAARAGHTAEQLSDLFLGAAGVSDWLVDTGFKGDELIPLGTLADRLRPARASEIVRLETVLEEVAQASGAAGLAEGFRTALARATASAVGVKSVIAYRHGLDFAPGRPSSAEVERAAGAWLRELERGAPARVSDPVLLRMALWAGVDTGLPVQLHTGYGDPDLDLRRCDPLLLVPWLKEIEGTGTDVVLLHCYPFHRNAGFLAQVFPHVHFDVGLAVNHTGAASTAVVAESLELAPFTKVLYSSDAWGPPELHHLGAVLWRRGTTRALRGWVEEGEWTEADALRVATLIGRTNAQRLYGLPHDSSD